MAANETNISTQLTFEVDSAKLEAILASITGRLEAAFTGAAAKMDTLERNLATAAQAAQELSDNAQNVPPPIEEAGENTRKLKDNADLAASSFSRVLGIAGRLAGVIAGAFSTKAIYDTMVSLQRSQATFSGIMHSSQEAERFLKGLRNHAIETGFSFDHLAKAAQGFMQYGMQEAPINDLLRRMHDMAGNNIDTFTSLTNILNQSMANLGKVERSTMFTLGRAGIQILPEIAKMRGTTVEALNAEADSIAHMKISVDELRQAIKNMTDEGGIMYKNAERQAATLDGRIGGFINKWRTIFASMLDSIAPHIAKLVIAFDHVLQILVNVGGAIWHMFGLPIFAVIVGIARAFTYINEVVAKAGNMVQTFVRVVGYGIMTVLTILVMMFFKVYERIVGFFTQLQVHIVNLATSIGTLTDAWILNSNAVSDNLKQLWLQDKASKKQQANSIKGTFLANAETRSIWKQVVAMKALTYAKMGLAGLVLAGADLAWSYFGSSGGKKGDGLWDTIMGGKGSMFADMEKGLQKLTQDIDITNNYTINAPTGPDGRTRLSPEQVQGVLQASRSNFAMDIQTLAMTAGNRL